MSERDEAGGRPTLTIGQLAAFAGVTTKAVRHYHRLSLLQEPPRDSSGYRSYGAQDAIDLVKIKTLAAAGVPLARVKELLAADPEGFTAAIAEIDRGLRKRTEELRRARERIAQLGTGDGLFVSREVADYLDHLRELGVSQRTVQMERDAWILVQCVSPGDAAALIAEKRDDMTDPEFRSLYLEIDRAFGWPADEPRLAVLAERSARWFAARQARSGGSGRAAPNPAVLRLIAASGRMSSPAWDRLSELANEHGGTGH